MRTEAYQEICCDYCNEVIHNHFDCPVCNKKYAATSAYGYLCVEDYPQIKCEECGANFNFLKRDEDDWEFIHIEQVKDEN